MTKRQRSFQPRLAQVEAYLNQCAHLNEGRGVLIYPEFAKKLKKMGVKGHYTIIRPLGEKELISNECKN